MARHVKPELLARLPESDIRPRRAARIEIHLAKCEHCRQILAALEQIPGVLASAHVPAMPTRVTALIDAALAAESTRRVAEPPTTDADRRYLRGRRERPQHGRAKPRGSRLRTPLALRALAFTAVAALVAVGGYEAAVHIGGQSGQHGSASTGHPASGVPAVPAAGPAITYQRAGNTESFRPLVANTNFTSSDLADQVMSAVRRTSVNGTPAFGSVAGHSAPTATAEAPLPKSSGLRFANGVAVSLSQLRGCVLGVAVSRSVELVEIARYQGAPAILIVLSADQPLPAQAWIVGMHCSASARDVLIHISLPGSLGNRSAAHSTCRRESRACLCG